MIDTFAHSVGRLLVEAANETITALADIAGVPPITLLLDMDGELRQRGATRHGYQCTIPTCLLDVGHPDHHEDAWGRSWRTYGDGPTCPHGINGGIVCDRCTGPYSYQEVFG